ncbi:Protein TRC8 homolog [Gryllus bimaculatus]|nr:Protein TRC8 homolog [Gryllus bimaculatus]
MANISFMVNQVMFFTLCDRLLLDESRVACLYSLMFYNVTAYCVAYIKELIHKEDWSPYVTITERSNVKHLAMSATKIVLEWTKAVTFIITVVFMLLVFGLEQGLQHYKPTIAYTVVTALFYMCTEKVFSESFPSLLLWLQPPALEGLEALWAPVLLRALAMTMSAVAAVVLLWRQPLLWRGPAAALYLNVWLRGREAAAHSVRALAAERAAVSRFRFATEEELAEFEDVCAVCLSPMKRARVTPCQHLFHGDCLRQCLQRSDHCPICKRELSFC